MKRGEGWGTVVSGIASTHGVGKNAAEPEQDTRLWSVCDFARAKRARRGARAEF